jgi:hypothetical protein
MLPPCRLCAVQIVFAHVPLPHARIFSAHPPTGSQADLSTTEKIADVWDKVKSISRVLVGILPGGPFRFGEVDVRGGKHHRSSCSPIVPCVM